MKTNNPLTLTTSPLSQPAGKPRRTASLTRRQRLLYGRKRLHPTGKERDKETGLYYYGARYLDSRTGRWLSGDPAVGEYVPEAPINDEARKRNGNLPGQGGVFNYVNLHVYHYAGNNPVKYVDPNGEWFLIDDFLVAVFAKISDRDDNGILKDTIRNFTDSWKSISDAIEHGKYIVTLFKSIIDDLKSKGISKDNIKIGEKMSISIDIDADWGDYLTIWDEETRKKWKEGDFHIKKVQIEIDIKP
jgi:RHS repeat-associated protein